ncbi:hypothetical protein [Streptomyces sp. NPDC051677]|uniref:hypothetical protein n=1 Tax=Streptomyces sp. NPDC051677 TaxID=3365669 RepID=UPI0037D3C84E
MEVTSTFGSVRDVGPSLAEAVDATGGLPEESVLWIAAQLAGVLAGLHQTGRGHGDLRLSTVLLTKQGVRLTGMGGHPVGPHEPSTDMAALGTLLATAYTGRRGATAPTASPAPDTGPSVERALEPAPEPALELDPDVGVLPVRLRQVVARCLAEESAAPPTPRQLLETIGPLTPTTRPWPSPVYELITRREVVVPEVGVPETLVPEPVVPKTPVPEPGATSGTRTADPTDLVPQPDPSSVPSSVPPTPIDVPPTPTPTPASPRFWLAALAVFALVAVIAVALVVLAPGRDSGPLTRVTPSPNAPTLQEPTPEPTWSADSESPEPSVPPQDEVTDLPEPSAEAPTPVETQPTRQPGAIADCAGKTLVEPIELLLFCGDGAGMLDNLTWTNWGEETATATGWKWERVCEPSCVEGTEARSPATVTVSGLTGGRYTFMQVSAPQSPISPLSHFTLDEFGPTLRD